MTAEQILKTTILLTEYIGIEIRVDISSFAPSEDGSQKYEVSIWDVDRDILLRQKTV